MIARARVSRLSCAGAVLAVLRRRRRWRRVRVCVCVMWLCCGDMAICERAWERRFVARASVRYRKGRYFFCVCGSFRYGVLCWNGNEMTSWRSVGQRRDGSERGGKLRQTD